MQLTALSRKSAVMALILLAVMISAAIYRRVVAPFSMELANGGEPEKLVQIIIAGVLFFGCGAVVGRVHPRSGLTSGYSALSMPLFALLACGIFVGPNMLIASSVSLCLAMALLLLLNSLRSTEEKDSIFFASLLLGAMVLIYPPAIVLSALLPLLVFILVFSMQQVVIMVVGYLFPFFVMSYVKWYTGANFWSVGDGIIQALKSAQMGELTQVPYIAIAIAGVTTILLVWGVIYAMFRGEKLIRMARDRRALHLFLWTALVALTMFFIPGWSLTIFAILAVPLSILLAFVLGFLPNNLSTIAYWVLLVLFVLHLFME